MFIPLFFMGGIIGRLFREFAVTVSVAVVASAAVSLTLTPVMCSLFLKREDRSDRRPAQPHGERSLPGWVGYYDRGLHLVFRHQFLDAADDADTDRRHRRSVHDNSERVFPTAGHWLYLR